MSIILLDPPNLLPHNKLQEISNAPLSACLMTGYISSVLKEYGFFVEIINANSNNLSIEETIDLIQDKSPLLLGVHLIYQWEETLKVLKMLESIKFNFSPHINLYGFYPTFAYKELLNNNIYIDSITIGEPEFTFLELADSLLNGNGYKNIFNIKGLSFVKCQEVIKNQDRDLIKDLDSLPFPDRLDFPGDSLNYILGSRGCYNQCSFCYVNPFYGKKKLWRGRNVESIVKEISSLAKNGNRRFYFADANFFGKDIKDKEKRGETLAFLLKKLDKGIQFGLECRADDVSKETFKKLKDVGLTQVFLGVENSCQDTLRRFNKSIKSDKNKEAIRIIQSLNIELFLGFIMFDQETTIDSLQDNFYFLKELNLLRTPSVTAHLLCHHQNVLQGTPDYQKLLSNNSISFPSYSKYEGLYSFIDSRVSFVYSLVEKFCYKILNYLEGKDLECSLNYKIEDSYEEINNLLILSFEETLFYFKDYKNCEQEKAYYFQEKILSQFSFL
ncbi:MAG: radical SAM protein [bacterium]|nr:radical SAM protein [bacterium]